MSAAVYFAGIGASLAGVLVASAGGWKSGALLVAAGTALIQCGLEVLP